MIARLMKQPSGPPNAEKSLREEKEGKLQMRAPLRKKGLTSLFKEGFSRTLSGHTPKFRGWQIHTLSLGSGASEITCFPVFFEGRPLNLRGVNVTPKIQGYGFSEYSPGADLLEEEGRAAPATASRSYKWLPSCCLAWCCSHAKASPDSQLPPSDAVVNSARPIFLDLRDVLASFKAQLT